MPTYDYRCPECEATLSETLTIAEYAKAKQHPILCAGTLHDEHPAAEMRRVFGAPLTLIQGLHPSRFKVQDQIANNRQAAHDRGEI